MAGLAGIRKSEENLLKTACRVAPVTKVADVDDVTTIENNRQVRVNIDATLVAIFRIRGVRSIIIILMTKYCEHIGIK